MNKQDAQLRTICARLVAEDIEALEMLEHEDARIDVVVTIDNEAGDKVVSIVEDTWPQNDEVIALVEAIKKHLKDSTERLEAKITKLSA